VAGEKDDASKPEISMRRIAALLLLFVQFPLSAIANPQAEEHVQAVVQSIHAEQDGALAAALVEEIDISRTSRFVLGRHLRDATPAQIEAFESRFRAYLVSFLSGRTDELAQAKIEIVGSSDRNPGDSIVTTRVSSPFREPMIMRWRLIERENAWRLVDVDVHGIWLAIEQRAQSASLLDRKDVGIGDLYSGQEVR